MSARHDPVLAKVSKGQLWLSRRWHDLLLRLYVMEGWTFGSFFVLCCLSTVVALAVSLITKSAAVAIVAICLPVVTVVVLVTVMATVSEIAPPALIEAAFRQVGRENADFLRAALADDMRSRPSICSQVAMRARRVVRERGPAAKRKQAREAELWRRQRATIDKV